MSSETLSLAQTLSYVKRTKEFKQLKQLGLTLVSSERQLSNGTLAFEIPVLDGQPHKYQATYAGAVISNKFVARRVNEYADIDMYRGALAAISELFTSRYATVN